MGEERMAKTINQVTQAEFSTRHTIAVNEKRNIFIEAGAGAGKSTSLVDRIYYLLREPVEARVILASGKSKAEVVKELSNFAGCEEREIVYRQKIIAEIDDIFAGKIQDVKAKDIYAITFTNKATEELRSKIVLKLHEEKNCTPYEISLKKILLKDIDNIHISTIHKFCEDILKENAVKAGLSPDFIPVVDEDEADIKNTVISHYFRKFKNWDDFQLFENAIGVGKGDIKGDIISLFDSFLKTACRLDYAHIYKCDSLTSNGIKDLHDALVKYGQALDDFIDAHANDQKKLNYKKFLEDNGYDRNQTDEEREIFLQNVAGFTERNWYENNYVIPQNRGPEAIKEEAFNIFAPLAHDILQKGNTTEIAYMQLCLKFAYELYEQYIANRDLDKEQLTNNDLIYQTYVLLKKDQDVLEKARKKIKRLFIDEYQDTDSLQFKIADLISQGKNDCLYIVGDPKQSIYRFRGAEPDVFFETRDIFEKNKNSHEVYDLNINFRSNSKIIDWVNSRYENIDLIEPSLGYQYKPMLCHQKNVIDEKDYKNPNNLIGFYIYRHYGAKDIANLIKHLKTHYKLRKDGRYQEIEYRDIMVLMKDHKPMPAYVEEFSRNNIPSKVYGESRFNNTLAVRAFVNLYSAILKDNSSGFAQAESTFRILYPAEYINKKHSEALALTQGLLNALRQKVLQMDAYGKAIYLVEHLSLLMKEKHIYQDYEINFASSKLYQMIEEVFSKGFYNGNELIDKFNEYCQKVVERESLIQKDIDAVMVINLHKAKGLEKPIVIWVSNVEKDSHADGISGTYKNGMLYPDAMINVVRKNEQYKDEVMDLKKDERFEEARQEYVAVTRPGEAFIFAYTEDTVSLFHDEDRDYHLEDDDVRPIVLPEEAMAMKAAEEAKEEQEEEEEEEKKEEPLVNPDLAENDDGKTKKYEEENHTYVKKPSAPQTISPSSLEASASPTRDRLKRESKEETKSNRPKSNDVGTILHRTLELYVKNSLTPEAAVETAISENINLIPSSDKGEFKAFFDTCLASFASWFDYQDYEKYPELSFSYLKDGNIFNGSIDLLLVKGDECIIIDYKSDEAEYISDDQVFETTLIEKYQNQLDAYEQVVKDLFHTENIKKKIIYFRRYDEVKRTIDVKCLDLGF